MKNLLRALPVVIAVALAACGGGGGASSTTPIVNATPSASPVPTATGSALLLASASPQPSSGGTDLFTEGGSGVNADQANGGQGGAVDGIPCQVNIDSQANIYHRHVHLSLFSSGQQIIVPQGIGLVNPAAPTGSGNSTFVDNAGCVYVLHTHDRSGIVHIEVPTAPTTPYTLGQLFDIWGQPLSTYNVAGISGAVSVYVTATTPDANNNLQPTAQPYLYMSDYRSLPLTAHDEITIEVNSPFVPIPRYSWASYFAGT